MRRELLESAGSHLCPEGELTKAKMTSLLVDFCVDRLFRDDWLGECLDQLTRICPRARTLVHACLMFLRYDVFYVPHRFQ